MDVSVIIPFVAEMPALAFTIQSVINELEGSCSYEILAIDNSVETTKESSHKEENGSKFITMRMEGGVLPNVRLISYSEKLSHWNAKNIGIIHSTGDLLFFLDAHCILYPGSLSSMVSYYIFNKVDGSLHLPIAYLLDQKKSLKYSLVSELEKGILTYKFDEFTPQFSPECVPCMSTCGMLISRDLMVNELEMWPSSLGVYSGGEHFFNFVLAVLGYNKYVFNSKPLHHYAAPRAYELSWFDIYRNRAIATYLYGGESLFYRFIESHKFNLQGKVSPRAILNIGKTIPLIPDLIERRLRIEQKAKISLEDWVRSWDNFS